MTHSRRLVFLVAATLLGAGAAVAEAQIAVGTRVGESTVVDSGSYTSLGRRDPFVSLITPRRGDRPTAPGQGLTGQYISDVVVTGVVKVKDSMTAFLQGADRRTYMARVGDRLADGVVRRIEVDAVVFAETGIPGSAVRPQEVRKTLRGAAEVIR